MANRLYWVMLLGLFEIWLLTKLLRAVVVFKLVWINECPVVWNNAVVWFGKGNS